MMANVNEERYTVTKNIKTAAIVLLALGVISIAYLFIGGGSTRAWASLLLGNFYFMAIALSATFFLAVQYVAEVGWSVGIKRVLMAMGTYLPYAGVLMMLIFAFGHHDLYFWTHEEYYKPMLEDGVTPNPHFDKILYGKQGYLNMPFYWIRLILYVVIWAGFAHIMRKKSLEEDLTGGITPYKKMARWSATYLVLFGITSSTAAWDIIMSIDAHWFSTLFGWYTFAGLFVTGLVMITMITLYLKSKGLLSVVNESHIHDLGKFMFAFSIFWTYLWFSQFMLIWYADLPEEATYYIQRQEGPYRPLFIANFVINFFFPFLILMTRDAKRKMKLLITIGGIMFIGHWIDLFLLIMPGTVGSHYHLLAEIGVTCFFAGLFVWVVANSLAKVPLIAKNHPFLEESIHHHI